MVTAICAVQVFRFTHYLPDKADYRVTLKSGPSGAAGFDAPVTLAAPPAGPGGREPRGADEPSCAASGRG